MKKQTFLVVMMIVIAASLALFAGALTLDTAETAVLAADSTVYVDANSVYTIPEDVVVTNVNLGNTKAVYDKTAGTITGKGYAGTITVTTEDGVITVNFRGATKWLPGLNILTGSTALYDGETAESAALTFTMDKTGTTRGVFEVAADPSNASNAVIKLTKSNNGQKSMTIYTKNNFDTVYNARPVQVVISHINPGFDSYCLINGTTGEQYKTLGLTKKTNGAWETKSVGKGTALKTSKDMTSIGLQFGPQDESVTSPVYIDNIAFIPYYEITYVKNDGVNVTDYVLYDSSAKLLTSYTIKTDITEEVEGKVFLGWSTDYLATTPMTTVPLNYEDITLYPVFSDSTIISVDSIYAAVNDTVTVTVYDTSADITLEFIPGNTKATFNEATHTVTGAGYAGTVTVKATANGVTEEVDVIFTGSEKWVPGLNILTSSTAPFVLSDDSDIAEDQFALLFAHDARAVATVESDPLVEILAGNVIKLVSASGQTYPYLYFKTPFDKAIEKERPVEFSYSYYGNAATWVNANGRSSNDIYRNTAGEIIMSASTENWTNGSATLTASTRKNNNDVNFFSFVGMMKNSTEYAYINALSYIPYYKVTYYGLDGETVAATEYVLKDTNGNFLTEYTLTRPVEGATSYYLDKELTKQVENNKIALANADIFIYSSVKNEVVYSVNDTVVTKEYSSENVTIAKPSETDASLSDTNFVVWVDDDGKKYYAGDVVASADLAGKTLTAYLQDATKPAVSYAYNGNYAPAYEKAGYRYTELIEDEGRDVLHIHLWNGFDGKGETFPTDWRVSLRFNNANNTYTQYDPTEYNLVQYITKIPAAYQNSSGKSVAMNAVNLRMYAHTSNGGVYTSPIIGITKSGIPVKDEYVAYLFDYSSDANFLAKAGYGFCVDYIHNATYGGDAYIDSLVVYRKGIFTVNYNTNAPDGATVIKNVEADTNRGVGTGYILKDIRPEVNGYIFKGWATTSDAAVADVVTTIDLKGDTTVYAVWEADTNYATTESEEKTEIKSFGTTHGIRFHTSTTNAVKNTVNELGFIVTRESFLTSAGNYDELTFDFKNADVTSAEAAPKYTFGVAYKKGVTDIVYGDGTNGEILYTAMVKGIPTAAKKEKLVVRPYAKYLLNGKEVTIYGNAMASSLYDVAFAVREEDGDAYANNSAYIDSILG